MADILTSKIQVPSLPDDTLILKDAEARNDLSTALATATGNPLNFSTRSAQKAKETVISLEPIQDLHGYDYPWPEGGGKNKIDAPDITGFTRGFIFSGKTLKAGTYTISLTVDGQATLQSQWNITANGSMLITAYIYSNRRNSIAFTLPSDTTTLQSYCNTDASVNIKEIMIEEGSTATDYAPYSNICPIDGRTETSLLGTNGKESTDPDYVESNNLTIQFGEKVHGAKVELEKGTVTVEWGYIAEYNGETLPGEWISDRDVYTLGTTPTTGAEVVYELATPRTIQLTPNEISLLMGINNISTDGDSISLTYRDGKVATLGDLDELNSTINNALEGKVDEVSGKGLSTNDYTDEEKAKVAEIDAKANDDGSYGDMAVGSLLMSNAVKSTDTTPFLFRPIPPLSTPYIREKLVGASMAWNQLVVNGNFVDNTGWEVNNGTKTVSNNVMSFTNSAQYGYARQLANNVLQKGHVYLYSFEYKTDSSNFVSKIGNVGYSLLDTSLSAQSSFNRVYKVGIIPSDTSFNLNSIFIVYNATANTETIQIKNVYVIDLTLAFGSTIANYLSTLDSQQSGAAIEWIKSYGFLTDEYYANDAGSIQSVCADRKVIKDADDTVETTISLGHDELRGVMQLDENNNLVYYGDEKASDGVIDRKFGIVDLGTLNYDIYSADNRIFYSDALSANGNDFTSDATYTRVFTNNPAELNDKEMLLMTSNHRVYIRDTAYITANALKTALSGVYLIYPLATPTTEQSTPFTSPQYLFDGGTEEFIDYGVEQQTRDVAVPVGHVTEYMEASDGTEIKDKFYLPTFPNSDGIYDLVCTIQNGELTASGWKLHPSNPLHDYSFEEKIVGTWIDETLYQKVIDVPSFGSGYTSVTHNLGIKNYVNAFGCCAVNGETDMMHNFPFIQGSNSCSIGVHGADSFSLVSSWNNCKAKICIQYTKNNS